MTNLGLEIVFWLILLTYLGARLTQTKKGYKQQYWKKGFLGVFYRNLLWTYAQKLTKYYSNFFIT